MKLNLFRCWFVLTMILSPICSAQQLEAKADHASGIYKIGQPIKWSVRWSGEGVNNRVSFNLKRGGLIEIQKGDLEFSSNTATFESKLDAPGTLLLEVKATADDGKELRALAGAVAGPDQIQPSVARPDDFDSFWEAKLRELESVPPNPQLERSDSGKASVDYWKITLDNIRGSHINGQLARPTTGDKLPAMLIVQWAGVYGLQKSWVTDRASEGWLTLNIEPHDLPIDEPESFYNEQVAGPLKNYCAIGNEDRDSSYFLRMYLSCYRAADYLAQRPDWDGRTLVVIGGSQGGLQALMTAAIHPRITAALAIVPAGCDAHGPDVGRSPGWPQWYNQVQGKDPAKVRRASDYYDVVNFASRIKCPVIIGAGLIDEVCPAEGILAACNQIRAPKEIIILPSGDHPNTHNSHEPYTKRCWGDWLPALRQGKPAPVASSNASLEPQ